MIWIHRLSHAKLASTQRSRHGVCHVPNHSSSAELFEDQRVRH